MGVALRYVLRVELYTPLSLLSCALVVVVVAAVVVLIVCLAQAPCPSVQDGVQEQSAVVDCCDSTDCCTSVAPDWREPEYSSATMCGKSKRRYIGTADTLLMTRLTDQCFVTDSAIIRLRTNRYTMLLR